MKKFLVVWGGQFASLLGSELTGFGLGVWIYLKTGSTTLFALNLLAFSLPSVLLSPLFGTLVDRFSRKWIMIFNDVGAGLVSLSLFFLAATDNLQVWHVYAATFLNASFGAFQWMANSAATTMLVEKKYLGKASGLVQFGNSLSMLISPIIGGFLFVRIGLNGLILIDLITFFVAVISLLFIHVPDPEPDEDEDVKKNSLKDNMMFGWRYIFSRPGMFYLQLYLTIVYFFVGMMDALVEPMLLDGYGPENLGVALSFMGLGAIGGTIIMSFWGGPNRKVFGIVVTGIFQGLVMIVTGATTLLPVIVFTLFLFSLLDPIVSTSSQAFWLSKVAPAVQGRVFSVRRITSRAALSLSSITAGLLIDYLINPFVESGNLNWFGTESGRGTGLLIVILGILMTILSGAFILIKSLRRADLDIPDAV